MPRGPALRLGEGDLPPFKVLFFLLPHLLPLSMGIVWLYRPEMWVFALDFEFASNDMNASWLKLLFFRTSDAGFGSPH